MIRTKDQLIKILQKIGKQKIEQGLHFKELALSIKHFKEQKNLAEWLKFTKHFLKPEDIGLKNDR